MCISKVVLGKLTKYFIGYIVCHLSKKTRNHITTLSLVYVRSGMSKVWTTGQKYAYFLKTLHMIS